MDWDSRPGLRNPRSGPKNQDQRLKIQTQDTGPGIQDFRSRTKSPDPGPDICDQGLSSILHTDLTFLAQMIFLMLKYSL